MMIKRMTYFALVTLLSLVSCSKGATEPDVIAWGDGAIYFRPSLADVVSSRAQDMTLDRLESFQVTCFYMPDIEVGTFSPYFENATFIRNTTSGVPTFGALPEEGRRDWPGNDGVVRFFAFSPSLSVMADDNSAFENIEDKSSYFNFINTTGLHKENDKDRLTPSVGYRLGKIRINPDISKQYDFIAADVSGTKLTDFKDGVELAFSHRLCQVELRAWGDNEKYNFEIAGVRIGNPVVESTFVFADDAAGDKAKGWDITDAVKDKVEYLYQGAGNSVAGDKIIRINETEHNTQTSAVSIMGQGGCAMVIPTYNQKWEGSRDPNIEVTPYTTDKMYFSVLIRITDKIENDDLLYPFPDNPNGMTVIYYAVDQSDNIVSRLYANEDQGTFFTDPELQNPYIAGDGEVIKEFGWVAVPVEVDWKAGKRYIYTLDYTEGVGWRDPHDPAPGVKIFRDNVVIDLEIADWKEGKSTDVIVPWV
ncbi:MAG: fimbrillin family protein [Muribaculaceae bacterium]|nr:fimbrillin family protein [Muribaculaceae bacterium]MDE5844738.1 fimbrillin family protein [Muribaculaceae bacterium]MDE5856785.1 fimbrillin family protein [Muribaculaceae bacterium]